MKKVIFVIVLCILNLAIIAPRSFDTGRDNIMEAYSFNPGCEMEVAAAINRLDRFETGIKLFTLIVLITTVVLGIIELSKKKEETPITNAQDEPITDAHNDEPTDNVQPKSDVKDDEPTDNVQPKSGQEPVDTKK